MPFMLYSTCETNAGTQYTQIRKDLKLAGDGAIAAIVRTKNRKHVTPFQWSITERELLQAVNPRQNDLAVVFDLKPKVAENVSLYRLVKMWGHSYSDWTPMALCIERLFMDHIVQDPASFKERFAVRPQERLLIGEFLYTKGGTKSGTWNWGMVGRVNGALLWGDAYMFLTKSLRKALLGQ